jgi:sulfite exporter TauE/SafE
MIGLCTTLLPCGWLYAFAITAAGTGNPVYGGWVMAVFWVGTLPLLIAVGASTRIALGRFGRVVPGICALGLIVVGTMTLFHRASLSAETVAQLVAGQQSSAAKLVPDANALPPCCQDSAPHQEHP